MKCLKILQQVHPVTPTFTKELQGIHYMKGMLHKRYMFLVDKKSTITLNLFLLQTNEQLIRHQKKSRYVSLLMGSVGSMFIKIKYISPATIKNTNICNQIGTMRVEPFSGGSLV